MRHKAVPCGEGHGLLFPAWRASHLFRDGLMNTTAPDGPVGCTALALVSALRPHPQTRHLREKQKGESVSAWLPSNTERGAIIKELVSSQTSVLQRKGAGKEWGWREYKGATERRPDRFVNSLVCDKKSPKHPASSSNHLTQFSVQVLGYRLA